MKGIFQLSCIGWVLEAAAIYGFIAISKTGWAIPGKQIVITLFCLAVLMLFIYSARFIKLTEMALVAAFLSVGFIVIYQALGFSIYPGLVKNIGFLSAEHIKTTFIVFVLVGGGYSIAILVAMLTNKLLPR